MRPPICVICHKDFRDDPEAGGLVRFRLSEEDRKYNERFSRPGYSGHPRGQHWFCGIHYPIAAQYMHLTWEEAAPLIQQYST